jgi:ABC-type glycerol-3-phosphate transport system permease component
MIGDIESLDEQLYLAELLKYSLIVVASLPVMLLYPFVQKYFVRGVMIGALKG